MSVLYLADGASHVDCACGGEPRSLVYRCSDSLNSGQTIPKMKTGTIDN